MATSRLGSSPGGWDNRMNIADNPFAGAVDALSNSDFEMLERVVAKVCGRGKPTAKGIKAALASHIDASAVVTHDKEKSHRGLTREVGCDDEAYRADVTDPEYLAAMEMVNSLCSWLRRYLWRFTGMSPKNLQSFLNWYTYLFRVRRAREKWPETERVVRHLVMTDASYRTSGAYGATALLDCKILF